MELVTDLEMSRRRGESVELAGVFEQFLQPLHLPGAFAGDHGAGAGQIPPSARIGAGGTKRGLDQTMGRPGRPRPVSCPGQVAGLELRHRQARPLDDRIRALKAAGPAQPALPFVRRQTPPGSKIILGRH